MMIFSIAVMLDGAKSMPDLSVGRSQSLKNENPTPYMPLAGEGKKKKGFFSFLKKEKKFTVVRRIRLNFLLTVNQHLFAVTQILFVSEIEILQF